MRYRGDIVDLTFNHKFYFIRTSYSKELLEVQRCPGLYGSGNACKGMFSSIGGLLYCVMYPTTNLLGPTISKADLIAVNPTTFSHILRYVFPDARCHRDN